MFAFSFSCCDCFRTWWNSRTRRPVEEDDTQSSIAVYEADDWLPQFLTFLCWDEQEKHTRSPPKHVQSTPTLECIVEEDDEEEDGDDDNTNNTEDEDEVEQIVMPANHSQDHRLTDESRDMNRMMIPFISNNNNNPLFQMSALEYMVYTSQWQVFWGLFLFFNNAPHSNNNNNNNNNTMNDMYQWLDPNHVEMMATLYLADYLLLHSKRTIPSKNIRDCVLLLDPLFEWEEHVVRPLQYKKQALERMGLPEDVHAMIWKDHVQAGVLYDAIIKCVKGIVDALDENLSQMALHGR